MKVVIKTISASTGSVLYYGKTRINGNWYTYFPKDTIPFDTENMEDLKRLINKIKTFERTGYNKKVVAQWVLSDGRIKRDLRNGELESIQKRNIKK